MTTVVMAASRDGRTNKSVNTTVDSTVSSDASYQCDTTTKLNGIR